MYQGNFNTNARSWLHILVSSPMHCFDIRFVKYVTERNWKLVCLCLVRAIPMDSKSDTLSIRTRTPREKKNASY